MSSAHATTPTALGTFFTYPQDAVGTVEDYWRDAGGTHVRMTGACKRAFLATIEALVERAVVPANVGNVPASVNALASATFRTTSAPYSMIDLDSWAAATDRDDLGDLLVRGLPYGVWCDMVARVWNLFALTAFEISVTAGETAKILAWQNALLDFDSSGFIEAMDPFWSSIWSRDWAGASSDQSAQDGEGGDVFPWGPYIGGSGGGSDAVLGVLYDIYYSLGSGISVGGGSGNLTFVEDALDLSYDVIRKDFISPGNWFTTNAASRVGAVTYRRSAAAWGVLQAMLAQMRFTHLDFPLYANFEHTIEERTVERTVSWDPVAMDWTCEDTDDYITTSSTVLTSLTNSRGYVQPFNVMAEVVLSFRVDNSDPDAMGVLALASPPLSGYAHVGRSFLDYCTVASTAPATLGKGARRQYATGVDSAGAIIPAYPATALLGYVSQFGGVHFAAEMRYENSTTQANWRKFCLRQEAGDADLDVPVGDFANWLVAQMPAVTLPQIAAFSQAAFDAGVSTFWGGISATYPSSPNCTVGGVPMYFPTAIGEDGRNTITLDTTDNFWKGTIRLGFPSDAHVVFPVDGDDELSWDIFPAARAVAGYEWQFKAMPTA